MENTKRIDYDLSLADKKEGRDKIEDLLDIGYVEFVKKLKKNANDPKVKTILNLGKKDGLNDEAIKVTEVSITAKNLIPTQSQIGLADSLGYLREHSPEGAAKLIKGDTSAFKENRILTANNKYILDGHHRWSQVFLFNPDAKIPSVNLTIPDLDEGTDLLKVVQLAIAATYGDIKMKPADAPTDIFNLTEKQIREQLPELMGEKMLEIVKTSWGLKSSDEVYDKITKNAILLKGYKSDGAPERLYMPQPSDTADDVGEPSDDYKGMPSAFIKKVQSGDLNFKEPILTKSMVENRKWVKTFENFRKK
jgi:hypothetical protein